MDAQEMAEVRLLDGEFYAGDPHRYWRWMRENDPLFRDEHGKVWAVTLHEDLLAVSKDPGTFSSAGGIRPDAPAMPYMIDLDDPLHKKRRRLVNRGFTVRRVLEREERVREVTVSLIEKAAAAGTFDFVTDLAAWLPLIVIGDMLGVEPERYDDLLRWSDDLVMGTGATTVERMTQATQAFEEYTQYQREVIATRRRDDSRDDLVRDLVLAEIEGERLDDEEILWESLLILIGGDETTRHVISGGMDQLLRNPQERQKLLEDPGKIPSAVEEMIRWVSPIQNMCRTATRDTDLRGKKISEGDHLLLFYPSANRDEAIFDDPFRFDVERTPNDHVAFGFGSHFCLGASLARLELRILFEEILPRLPDLRLATDDRPPMRASNFISGIESLPVSVK